MLNATSLASLASAILLLLLAGAVSAQEKEAVIEFRLAREVAAPGFVLMEPLTFDDAAYVEDRSVVSDVDIPEARLYVRDDGLVLRVSLSAEGAVRLAQATGANIGGRLAVLVDSRLVGHSVIHESIPAAGIREVGVGLELPEAVVEELAAKIAARWPQ